MARSSAVLLVDDEEAVRFPIRRFLATAGYAVVEAQTVAGALEVCRASLPDAAVLDFSLPDGDGLDLLRQLRAMDASLPVIILTGHGTIDLAVKAMQEGADQFFTKPVELPTLRVVLDRAVENRRSRQESLAGRSAKARSAVDPFLGTSPAVKRLADQAARVASAAVPVLIQGETGSGKGVLARWLHDHGPRAQEPFVDLNCAGLSRELLESELFGHEKGAFTGAVAAKQGLLELAHRGTFFLDEIGDVDVQVQAKLLKVLEELRFRRLGDVKDRRVDVRLIAATHHDLARQVQEGKFREDLYYRISAVPLQVPPLRERGKDAVLLARGLLARIGTELGRPGLRLSDAAEGAVAAARWPGNIRQLRNALERAVLLGNRSTLEAEDVTDAEAPPATPARLTLAEAERRHIEAVLGAEGGNVAKAALVLGLSRSALYEKIRKHGLALSRSTSS
ncbi:MAG TPA: sigma-54 dependent transcriptional regulator [Vicinamibacteria bacterium]|nr:sigma-54 dependent transcriptional regulator [Vicinamibacteria bacterium]